MKKLMITMLMLLAPTIAQAEDLPTWTEIEFTPGDMRMSALTADLIAGRPTDTGAKLWTKFDNFRSTTDWASSKVLYSVNCSTQTYHQVSFVEYRADGAVIRSGLRPYKIQHVIPETNMASAVRMLCSPG